MANMFRCPMENYKGRHIGCAPGTHEAIVNLILKHSAPVDGVLDIGANAGALLTRLQDSGFQDLTGLDLDVTRFNVPEADFFQADANGPFPDKVQRDFSLITATDVIEHLDNPRAFIEKVLSILRPDGFMALSFPNVAFWEGRLKFMFKGELWGFGKKNYKLQRHISPMTFEQTELMLRELGFDVLELTSAGSFATPLRKAVSFPARIFFQALGGDRATGESVVLVAQRADAETDLKAPEHYRQRWAASNVPLSVSNE